MKITIGNEKLTPDHAKNVVLQSLDDDKAIDIITIPLAGKSTIADFMIIASGTSSRQVAAMAEHVEMRLKHIGVPILGKEGVRQGDWILLDTADVIVHLFRPEVREFYALERMWAQSAENDELIHVNSET